MTGKTRWLSASVLIAIVLISANAHAAAPTPMLVAYGGHNETMIPIWVGVGDTATVTQALIQPQRTP